MCFCAACGYSCRHIGSRKQIQQLVRDIVKNQASTVLNLTNRIASVKSITALLKALAFNRTICNFDATGTALGSIYYNNSQKSKTLFLLYHGVSCILHHNHTLTTLILCKTDLNSEDAAGLAAGLRQNKTLRRLDVSQNWIGDEGCAALFQALCHNDSLCELKIVKCGQSQYESVETMLRQNHGLLFCDLGYLPPTSIPGLQCAWQTNETLLVLMHCARPGDQLWSCQRHGLYSVTFQITLWIILLALTRARIPPELNIHICSYFHRHDFLPVNC